MCVSAWDVARWIIPGLAILGCDQHFVSAQLKRAARMCVRAQRYFEGQIDKRVSSKTRG